MIIEVFMKIMIICLMLFGSLVLVALGMFSLAKYLVQLSDDKNELKLLLHSLLYLISTSFLIAIGITLLKIYFL